MARKTPENSAGAPVNDGRHMEAFQALQRLDELRQRDDEQRERLEHRRKRISTISEAFRAIEEGMFLELVAGRHNDGQRREFYLLWAQRIRKFIESAKATEFFDSLGLIASRWASGGVTVGQRAVGIILQATNDGADNETVASLLQAAGDISEVLVGFKPLLDELMKVADDRRVCNAESEGSVATISYGYAASPVIKAAGELDGNKGAEPSTAVVADEHQTPNRLVECDSDTTGKANAEGEFLSEAELRIMTVINSANGRITTKTIMNELLRLFEVSSLGTTKSCLATLVRRNLIDNRQDVKPNGYRVTAKGRELLQAHQ